MWERRATDTNQYIKKEVLLSEEDVKLFMDQDN